MPGRVEASVPPEGGVPTLCPYCGVGCGLTARVERGRLRRVEGIPDHPVNRGRTCRKPLELPSAVHARDRATTPLTRERRDTRFRATGWDEAIWHVARGLRQAIARHGPDAVAFYVSGQLLTEDYYAVTKLAKGFLGTNNVDSNSRLCMASAVAGYDGAFGSDGPPASYDDIDEADCLFLLGSNAAACHPIVWARIRDRQARGAHVACADPRRTATAEGSDLHLPVLPGTDLALLNAMLHVVERDGLLDCRFLEDHAAGVDEALAVAREWPPERAAGVCGVPAADIEATARRFAAGRSMAVWSQGANQSRVGTLKNRALINLCLATGQIGRPGTGPLSLTGQPNAMGGRVTGGSAAFLPGFREVARPEDRAEMERLWGVPAALPGISPRPGLHAVELFEALEDGRVKVVWIVATNPAVSFPEVERARAALRRAELVVVQDAFHPTETSALAHVVLPAASWPEKEGTMINSERRVGLVRAALDPPGEALPDWQVFARLAGALGWGPHFAWRGASEVWDEFARCTAGRVCDVTGIDFELLRERPGGVRWPHPAGAGAGDGAARLYPDHAYPTPDGRARLAPTPHAPPAEEAGGDFPLTLVTGRVANQWHTMTRTGKSEALLRGDAEPFVELAPPDAARAGVGHGDLARVASRRGGARARVVVVPSLPPGVAFAPFHWGGLHAPAGAGALNAVTGRWIDPTSKQAELKATAVRVEPVRAPGGGSRNGHRRRLVVVGTGMAGLRVAEEVLERAPGRWRITMLGEEDGPAYNRIQLSRLLARAAALEDLELQPRSWYESRGVELRGGSPAVALAPGERRVRDAHGAVHLYDALVIATGSRCLVPPVPGAELPHVFPFRTTADAAAIAERAARVRSAVVVGGGLLGLEAAAGLRGHGAEVAVVEVGDRLMARQLDLGGGRMLGHRLAELGLAAHLGRRVAEIRRDSVRFEDGGELPAELVVMAAGIRPETTLAREAGLEVGRGVLVDDEMRTSAPAVWAVGECAEHRGTVYGLWAPLADQARAAGASVAGDPAAFVGATTATTLKVAGIDVFAGGLQDAAHGQDELVWSDSRRRAYRKLVLEGDRLVGAMVVGDREVARRLTELLRTGADVPASLLDPPAATGPECGRGDDDIVCSCNRRTRGELLRAIRANGLGTVPEVARATAATTGCGSCAGDVEELLAGFAGGTNGAPGARKLEPDHVE